MKSRLISLRPYKLQERGRKTLQPHLTVPLLSCKHPPISSFQCHQLLVANQQNAAGFSSLLQAPTPQSRPIDQLAARTNPGRSTARARRSLNLTEPEPSDPNMDGDGMLSTLGTGHWALDRSPAAMIGSRRACPFASALASPKQPPWEPHHRKLTYCRVLLAASVEQ
ncbi:hypothetical protein B0T18DRAFT_204150 [Schizothecium vesticola]|uniref:Uncharacterized protein n=1 Tax=Schizothecium vesticola TaxID=314040 RepID=A0AA40JYP0_9PEZI|nr:hypothetical protein B0T18DRAFT_204150 [Schizothecium vesticola]